MDAGAMGEDLESWVREEHPNFDPRIYGFQEFSELLNFAQDKLVVRVEPTEEHGLIVHLGAEFYPPAPEPKPEEPAVEEDEKQPETNETPALMEQPKAKRPRRTTGVKRPRKAAEGRAADSTVRPRRTTRKKPPTPSE
jgi:OST-HTH/LOTUS domain